MGHIKLLSKLTHTVFFFFSDEDQQTNAKGFKIEGFAVCASVSDGHHMKKHIGSISNDL